LRAAWRERTHRCLVDAYGFGRAEGQQAACASQARAATRSATRRAWAGHCTHLAQKDVQYDSDHDHGGSCHSNRVVTCISDTYFYNTATVFLVQLFRPVTYQCSIFVATHELMEERTIRPRGAPQPEQLKASAKKYRSYDESAATEWQRLKLVNSRRALTPEVNAVEHARWIFLLSYKHDELTHSFYSTCAYF
jgi:hypothetical protein